MCPLQLSSGGAFPLVGFSKLECLFLALKAC